MAKDDKVLKTTFDLSLKSPQKKHNKLYIVLFLKRKHKLKGSVREKMKGGIGLM